MGNSPTPAKLNYSMPAEWERHSATWLAWPKNAESFPEEIIASVESTYLEIISALAPGEKVNILVDNKPTEEKIRAMLPDAENVFFYHIKTGDVWVRDYGPIFVKNGPRRAAVKWIFNSWGGKYKDLESDNEVGMEIVLVGGSRGLNPGYRIFETDMVLEGGSIDSNGAGSCLTTEECLLNKNRNPGLSKLEIENYLMNYLGFKNILWLKKGLSGDDTDGHIDNIARFVNKNTVIAMIENNKATENYRPLKENLEFLEKAKDRDGKRFNIVPLAMPGELRVLGALRPASFANFYIANSAVLVPVFNDKNDETALSVIAQFFPERKVVGINCRALLYGFGGLHCITREQPA